MRKVLVTGGCGYIGSHTVLDLIENGFEVITVDNHVNSFPEALDGVEAVTGVRVKNYNIDLRDLEKTKTIFQENRDIIGVIHFAALKNVGESVDIPLAYYENNLSSLIHILQCIKEFEVPNFIFSSSCSVYGNAKELPVTEDTPFGAAESPYAQTKQMGENILRDFSIPNKNINTILLRYFNPAGAHQSNLVGEFPVAAVLNLVPAITQTASGKIKEMVVHGDTYDTRDGSCIRDYIHVMDLANAHTKALQYLVEQRNESNCEVFNLGIGQGVSVLEAIHAFEKVTGKKLNFRIGPPRAGDVVAIYANYKRAAEKLHWAPKYNIEDIMRTAWEWEKKSEVSSPKSNA